nr:cytochrome-c peroxidase [Planctomycetota bacterium]
MKFSLALSTLAAVAVAVVALPSGAAAQGGGLLPPPAPPGNPVTTSKALLGKALFWDEQLSSTRTLSCGGCHLPEAGGSDPRSVLGDPRSTHPGPDGVFGTADDVAGSPGVTRSAASGLYVADPVYSLAPQVTGRRAMPAINGGYGPRMVWDGRAGEGFRDPITNPGVLTQFAAPASPVRGPPAGDGEVGGG